MVGFTDAEMAGLAQDAVSSGRVTVSVNARDLIAVAYLPMPAIVTPSDSILASAIEPTGTMTFASSVVVNPGSGADSSPSSLAAIVGAFQSSTNVPLEEPRADAVSITMVSVSESTVYSDDPRIRVAMQVRDAAGNTRTLPATSRVRVLIVPNTDLHIALPFTPTGICEPDPVKGICLFVSDALPMEWFSVQGSRVVTVRYGFEGVRPDLLAVFGTFTLAAAPVLSVVNDLLLALPLSPVYTVLPGSLFSAPLFTNISQGLLTKFSFEVETDPVVLRFDSMDVDSSAWNIQSSVISPSITGITATAKTAVSGFLALGSLRFTVLEAAGSRGNVRVNMVVTEISTSHESITNSASRHGAKINDRFGGLGAVVVLPTKNNGLFPVLRRTHLLNTAVITQTRVSTPLTIYTVSNQGEFSMTSAGLFCFSSNSAVASVMNDCSEVYLSGSELSDGVAEITIFSSGLELGQTIMSVRVWFPRLPLAFTLQDDTVRSSVFVTRIEPAECTFINSQLLDKGIPFPFLVVNPLSLIDKLICAPSCSCT